MILNQEIKTNELELDKALGGVGAYKDYVEQKENKLAKKYSSIEAAK
jgi:hypothetical protein